MITEIGRVGLAGEDGVLRQVVLPGADAPDGWIEDVQAFPEAAGQVRAYLEGRRTRFDVAHEARGSAFQRAVWEQVAKIPFGHTATYGELARAVGDPGAARAVGAANGANPLPLVIPCHRVVGVGGDLVGYGGGLALKRWLLALEGGLPGLLFERR